VPSLPPFPHPAPLPLAHACSTDILLGQKSPAFDERDIARNAASCMCVGSPAFTSMGKALYKGISPRLGGDTEGVEESSPQPKMKELLKVRGRGCGVGRGRRSFAGRRGVVSAWSQGLAACRGCCCCTTPPLPQWAHAGMRARVQTLANVK